ncbi:hypothetical protein K505DRAFT_352449 [Melanomma pulvis-pyrius CBS 109.77]|uniref:Uncharacterized protein n=1 Tax=Melanomma pulvis-pyrius CBS 109.77 TaxID=1314802 RepID=A0A6A6WZH0_9PLEO|nr:hypothetical protein K505DRAFT_352449 [Melanomma pulvis-pyrius CBS 109.77]
MLARLRTVTARAARTGPIRTAIGPHCHVATTRAYHTATAEFTNLGPDGTLVTKEVSIHVGDPGEAYILIPTEVGYALQAGSYLTNSSSALPKRPDRFALSYFHDTQHFAVDSSPGCPRLVIPQQLPCQSAANTSSATLYLYGVMHTIALDGTPDARFAEIASKILPEIGGALDKLKDM